MNSDPEAELFRLKPGTELTEVKRVYRRAALGLHPDHNPDPTATRRFRRATELYQRLVAAAPAGNSASLNQRPPEERLRFLLADIRDLLKRWSADRWSRVVDGLPAAVWVAGVLDVAGSLGNGPGIPAVNPTPEGIAVGLRQAEGRLASLHWKTPLRRPEALMVRRTLDAAEKRLRALTRPTRAGRPEGFQRNGL